MSGIQVQQLELPIEFVLIAYMGKYRAIEKMEPLPLENHKLLGSYVFPKKYWYRPPPPSRETIGPLQSNRFLSEVRTALCKMR